MLKDIQIKALAPFPKTKKYFDGGGLFLLVTPNGGKWWRLKYRFHGKERLLSLGVYPGVTLKEAREKKDELKKLLENGINPTEHRKAESQAERNLTKNSSEKIAIEWLAKEVNRLSARHLATTHRRFERDVFPYVGTRQPDEIKPQDLLAIAQKVVDRGAIETAHRVIMACGQVFRFAVVTGRAYNRTTHIEDRRDMMQVWADYLDGLRGGKQ